MSSVGPTILGALGIWGIYFVMFLLVLRSVDDASNVDQW